MVRLDMTSPRDRASSQQPQQQNGSKWGPKLLCRRSRKSCNGAALKDGMISSKEESSEQSKVKRVESLSKDQSAGAWRSNLCLPYEKSNDQNQIPDHVFESSGVQIPIDGWYAFCFGRADGNQKQKEPHCLNHSLLLLDRSLPNGDENMLQWTLPLTYQPLSKKRQEDSDKNQAVHVICIHIGKLMYLTKNTRLLVVKSSRGEVDRNPATKDASTFRWVLVHAPNVAINSRNTIVSTASRHLQTYYNDDQS